HGRAQRLVAPRDPLLLSLSIPSFLDANSGWGARLGSITHAILGSFPTPSFRDSPTLNPPAPAAILRLRYGWRKTDRSGEDHCREIRRFANAGGDAFPQPFRAALRRRERTNPLQRASGVECPRVSPG